MKCVIPSLNIKAFARAVHSLSKVGEELYVEPSTEGLAFRSVNSSRSGFGSFFFGVNFFSVYEFKIAIEDQENFKCKIAMKAFVNAFKSVNSVDRSVEKCRLVIDSAEDRLVVNLMCKHGINKTYNLPFIECETLQAAFDKEKSHFKILAQSRVLCDAFVNFQAGQEEVTLSASPQKVFLRNYVDDDPDPSKSIHTELQIERDEFDAFDVDRECHVTFCLKEVRSVLSFSEPNGLPVTISFSAPGSPIIFSAENPSMFEANFVLATLANSSSNGMDVSQHQSEMMYKESETAKGLQDNIPRKHAGGNSENHVSVCDTTMIQQPNTSVSKSFERLKGLDAVNGNESLPENSNVSGEDEEVVVGTPPAKKRRFYFKRCFESTFDPMNFTPFQRILAGDSDEDT